MTRIFRHVFFILLLSLAIPVFAQKAPPLPAPISLKQQQANARLIALWAKTSPHSDSKRTLTLPAVQKAIAAGADIHAEDQYGNTALMMAAGDGNFFLVKWLLAHEADKKDLNKALWFAGYRNDMTVLPRLIEFGTDVKSPEGQAALLEISRWGNVAGIRLFLEHGADVNVHDDKGNTPLIFAASEHWPASGDIRTVRFLLAHGARIDTKGDRGVTALMTACDSASRDIVHLLLEHGPRSSTCLTPPVPDKRQERKG